jgi:CRISPR-associated protein Csd1
MIIQALNEYYGRLKREKGFAIPSFGFSNEKIHFVLVIQKSGKLVDVKKFSEKDEKKNIAKQLIVPAPNKKASGIISNFMWGNTGYVLGSDNKEYKDKNRIKKMFKAFKEFHHSLGDETNDTGMSATLKFLDLWQPKEAKQLKYWEEMAGMNLVFQLDGEHKYIHEHAAIKDAWIKYYKENQSNYQTFCLVSGQKKPIARLHPSIKGLPLPAQPSGTSIVSFNLDSFCSYNKEQSFNAPVSEEIAFNYTTALNYLLRFDSRQKLQIGDTTTIFWSESPTPVEGFLKDILKPQVSYVNLDLRIFLEASREGKMPKEIENTKNMKFYVLGLSPNASRLSVRFWYVSSVEDIIRKIGQHFKDLTIEKNYENEPQFPGMWHLLHETAIQGKSENISPLLAGAFIRSILTGQRYPSRVLTIILERIRADQKINYLRAALLKAYIVRNWRFKNKEEREVICMSLDKDEKNIGYRLGRLFAILEKAQKDAIPGASSTIKDRYYGSASATPAIVFPQLLRLAQHHIQKSEYGINIDKHIENIVQDIRKFPSHLSLEDQGIFALGYYHQKQELYKKLEKKEESNNE